MSLTQKPGEPISIQGFGLIEYDRILKQDELFVVIRDKYPVSAGHTLVIPSRDVRWRVSVN